MQLKQPIGLCAVTLLASFCLSAGSTSAQTGTQLSAKERLRCVEIQFSQSAETRDLDTFKAMMDPDVRWLTPAGVLHGPEQVAQAWGAFFTADGPSIAWRPEHTEVLDSGDLALSRGPYRLRTLDQAGELSERWGLFQSVWRRTPTGQWRIVFDAGAEDGMTPSAAQKALLDQAHRCEEIL